MIAAGASGLSANLTTSSFTRDAMLQVQNKFQAISMYAKILRKELQINFFMNFFLIVEIFSIKI